ncbi:Uncharacterised protein [uncultured archaeon]|nr:Uncharacterised protein [uncultured archaeon]
MRIDFEREGGYAPLQLEYHADTDVLPVETRDKLLDLVKRSKVMEIQQSDLERSSQSFPDAFTYKLSITEGGKSKSLSFNDITVPASLHPLLELFQELALEQRLKK